MTLTWLAGKNIQGLSTDTKPTNVPAGWIFLETNTLNNYISNGSGGWTLISSPANSLTTQYFTYTYFVYKSGSNYVAQSGNSVGSPTTTTNASFQTILQGIISAISPAGTPTLIKLGVGDFNLDTQFAIPQSAIGNITMDGSGMGLTNIVITSNWNNAAVGSVAFKVGAIPTIAASNTGTLTANCAIKSTTCTVSTTDAAKFAAGDYVLLTSTKAFSTAPTAATPQAETKRVYSVNTGTGVITFDVPTFDTYNTADTAVIYNVTSSYLKNIKISNLSFKKGSGLNVDTTNHTGPAFFTAYNVENLDMDSVELVDPVVNYDAGLAFKSILNSRIRNCHLLFNTHTNTYDNQYGISIGNCSQDVVISDCNSMGRFRHPFELVNDASGAGQQGVMRNITAVNCTANGAEIACFSTHTGGEMISFVNCKALGSMVILNNPVGFEIRARKTQLIGCSAEGTSFHGFQISGDAHDCIVDGCLARSCGTSTNGGEGIRLINDLSGIKRTKITNSNFIESFSNGIRTDSGCDYTQIIGCGCIGNLNNGMYLKDSDYLLITDNVVNGNANAGIWVDPATLTLSNVQITNNVTQGNTAGPQIKTASSSTGIFAETNLITQNQGYNSFLIPDAFEYGEVSGTSSTNGTGIFNGNIATSGTVAASSFDTTNGPSYSYTTGNVAGNAASHKSVNLYTCRAFNPILIVKFMVTVATNNRTWIGWRASTNADPASGVEDALATATGVLLTQRSTDTNWQIATNNGNANSTFLDTGVAVAANTLYTLKLIGDASNNKFQWSLNGSQPADLTTTIPTGTTSLLYYSGAQTAEAVAHTMKIFRVRTRSDQ